MTLGPLAINIVIGVMFIVNGWQKLIFLQQTHGYFMMIGLPVETAILIGLLEVIGGVLLIVGLLTRVTAILFAIEMIGAFIINSVSNAIVLPNGYEFGLLSIPILLIAISRSFVLTGPGRLSIEWNVLKCELIPNGRKMVSRLGQQ